MQWFCAPLCEPTSNALFSRRRHQPIRKIPNGRQHQEQDQDIRHTGNRINQKTAAREEIFLVEQVQVGSESEGSELEAEGEVSHQVKQERTKCGVRRPFSSEVAELLRDAVKEISHSFPRHYKRCPEERVTERRR